MRTFTQVVGCFTIILCISCTSSKNSLFTKRSAHEKYGDKLKDAGLHQSSLGTAWFNSAQQVISSPQSISLPHKEMGFFAAEKPAAAGFKFTAKRGERINIQLSLVPMSGLFFLELWHSEPGKITLVSTMDSVSSPLAHTLKSDGEFIVRLQPELLHSVEYTVTITTQPSLAFPVDRSGDPKIISLWGVDRDGGNRKHEGVDIAAKFRTPALAAANGTVRRVTENNLGGKVIFLGDEETGNSLYYAHLDSQLVNSGQRVKAGDIIGLVGNTGNAKNTPPHLHFGIYTFGGPIDPITFINKKPAPKEITANIQRINNWVRTTATTNVYSSPSSTSTIIRKIENGDALFVLAATDSWYRLVLPDGVSGYVNSNNITNKPIRNIESKEAVALLDKPLNVAPIKKIIEKGSSVTQIGNYQQYYLVLQDSIQGWIAK